MMNRLAESIPSVFIFRMLRMYIDEVGTDDLKTLETDSQKFLSLTGVVMNITHARDHLVPALNALKADVFNHDPDECLCLHRKDIMAFKGKFGSLRDANRKAQFDERVLRLFQDVEYTVLTAFIDKTWMIRQHHWNNKHPYHYLMEILVEKYTLLLERRNTIGDLMPEARHGKSDKKLQEAFETVRDGGTRFVGAPKIQKHVPSKSLKFRTKSNDIAGLQLCDLLAHPSHYRCRQLMGHDVNIGPFAQQVQNILIGNKYDRSQWGVIRGYGLKTLP